MIHYGENITVHRGDDKEMKGTKVHHKDNINHPDVTEMIHYGENITVHPGDDKEMKGTTVHPGDDKEMKGTKVHPGDNSDHIKNNVLG